MHNQPTITNLQVGGNFYAYSTLNTASPVWNVEWILVLHSNFPCPFLILHYGSSVKGGMNVETSMLHYFAPLVYGHQYSAYRWCFDMHWLKIFQAISLSYHLTQIADCKLIWLADGKYLWTKIPWAKTDLQTQIGHQKIFLIRHRQIYLWARTTLQRPLLSASTAVFVHRFHCIRL